MRVDLDYFSYSPADWERSIATILMTEPRYIHLVNYRQGSVINYFTILNPEIDDPASPYDNNIRDLSGNEKMLLLYQWYITDDERIRNLPYKILNFDIYSADTNNDVVHLFEDTTIQPYVPPVIYYENGEKTTKTGYYRASTFEFTLSVYNTSPLLYPSIFLSLFVLLLIVL